MTCHRPGAGDADRAVAPRCVEEFAPRSPVRARAEHAHRSPGSSSLSAWRVSATGTRFVDTVARQGRDGDLV